MGRFFNLDSPLMTFLSKMADLMILNLLTLLCCLPIITAGDAMTALYYMTIKMVKNEECYIVKGYFKSFKENFKQATIIWLIALVVGIIFAGDFMILRNSTVSFGKVIMVLITIVAVIYLFTMIYIFPVLSRFENTVKNTIRNSFLMSVLNPAQDHPVNYHQPDSHSASSGYLAGNAAFDTFRIFRAGLCGKHVVRKDFQAL